MKAVITGTGSYIPTERVTNADFANNDFFTPESESFSISNQEIADKFQEITGIGERRWVTDDLTASDIAAIAAKRAIEDAGIDAETIDQIIVAHNFGDVKKGTIQTDILPSLASRVKHLLGIKNPECIPYDILFGCPGWVQGVIQAESFIKSGMAKKCLVIGAETLSRVVDVHDRDSMIFSDGAGASIIEGVETAENGILSTAALAHCEDEAYYLYMGKSNAPDADPTVRYIKMLGRKIYEYALVHVPAAMKLCLDKAKIDVTQVKKVFIHQANEKMDEAIIKRFFKLYKASAPEGIMPMSIHFLGNSSVATVPTLYDMVKKGQIEDHEVNSGDIILFASVGAGMNINAIAYKC